MKTIRISLLMIWVLFVVLMAGCRSTKEVASSNDLMTPTSSVSTQTSQLPSPTQPPLPTDTPFPTITLEPTDTPVPTGTPTPSQTPTQAPTETPIHSPTAASPDSVFRSAFAELQTSNFHFEYSDLFGLIAHEIVGDYQAVGNWQRKETISVEQEAAELQSILLGDTLYISEIDGEEWESQSVDNPEALISLFLAQLTVGAYEDLENLVFLGEKMLEEEPVYQFKASIPVRKIVAFEFFIKYVPGYSFPRNDVAVTYWIGLEDGHLKRVLLEGEMSFWDMPQEMSLQADFSGFGQEVLIEAPE